MQSGSFPVHDPRAGWRNTLGRRLVLLLGWAGVLTAAASVYVAPQVGAWWAWLVGPGAAAFSMLTLLVMPEPRPVAPPRPQPAYLLADQRLNLLAAMPAAEPMTQVIGAYRPSGRPLAVPQRQAA